MLRPTDLDPNLVQDDEPFVNDPDTILPQAEIPPRPADLRSKEGRAWKAKYGNSNQPRTEKLEGEGIKTSAGPKGKKRNVEHLKQVLLQFHAKTAILTSIEEIALDDEEATMLAESIAELLSYYNIKVEGKSGAILGLMYTATIIYGSRALPYFMPNVLEFFQRVFNKDGKPTVDQAGNVVRPNFS